MPALARARHLPASPRGGHRPFARATLGRRRLSQRLAFGLTPAEAARAEGLPVAEVDALLADPDFAGLVEEYRALEALPEDRARGLLTRLARLVLEEAVSLGDLRAACFVLREEGRGRDPARTLADGVIAARRRAASPPPPPPVAARPAATVPTAPRRPADPVDLVADRMAWRAAAQLRDTLVAEHAALHRARAESPEPPPSRPAPPARPAATPPGNAASPTAAARAASPTAAARAASPKRSLNRAQRRRLAALDRRRLPPAGLPPGADHRPAPRSRGP